MSLFNRITGWLGSAPRGGADADEGWRQAPHPPAALREVPAAKAQVRAAEAGLREGIVARLEAGQHAGGDPPISGAEQAATGALPFPSTGPHGHRTRMREKLLTRGPGALADYEMLEMLLFLAMPKGDTKPLAKALINRFGSFAAVLAAPQPALMATRGLGEHSVSALKLVQGAALRMQRAEVMDRPILSNWDRLEAYLASAMSRERVEQFRVLFLDTRNRLIADEVQGRGTVNHTPVYAREVARRAIELHATALILVHNHPSGDPAPSRADREVTAEIKAASALLGITLHDHIIVGNGATYSFRRSGAL